MSATLEEATREMSIRVEEATRAISERLAAKQEEKRIEEQRRLRAILEAEVPEILPLMDINFDGCGYVLTVKRGTSILITDNPTKEPILTLEIRQPGCKGLTAYRKPEKLAEALLFIIPRLLDSPAPDPTPGPPLAQKEERWAWFRGKR